MLKHQQFKAVSISLGKVVVSRACRIFTETDKSKRKPCLQKQKEEK